MKNFLKLLIPLKYRIIITKAIFNLRTYPKFIFAKAFQKNSFIFNGRKYKYFIALFNTTFLNERVIEIPIIFDLINQYRDKSILEIGNVMSHYFKVNYDIVDKYEEGQNIINCDIIDFVSPIKYDLIISISTFEHIGFDEVVRYGNQINNKVHPEDVLKAIEYTKSLLNPNGIFVFTAPLGFNDFLDSKLKNNDIKFTELHYLKRISVNNEWEQVQYQSIEDVHYGKPFICANGLLVAIYKNIL